MMTEYEFYTPLHYNNGRRTESVKLDRWKRSMVGEFGGLTHFLQENERIWKIGEQTFRDWTVACAFCPATRRENSLHELQLKWNVIGTSRRFLSFPQSECGLD